MDRVTCCVAWQSQQSPLFLRATRASVAASVSRYGHILFWLRSRGSENLQLRKRRSRPCTGTLYRIWMQPTAEGVHPHPLAPSHRAPCWLCACICVNSYGTWACALAVLPAPLRGNLSCFCQINQRPSRCVCVCGVCVVCVGCVYAVCVVAVVGYTRVQISSLNWPQELCRQQAAASDWFKWVGAAQQKQSRRRCNGAWGMEIEMNHRRCNSSINEEQSKRIQFQNGVWIRN